MKRETLTVPVPEIRLAADEEAATFEGYAAIFDEPVDVFNEVVRRGAFRRTLAEHRGRKSAPSMFWNHNPDEPIGVWTSLAEDQRGLRVSGRLVTATTRGREAHELLKAGAVTGLSIGFRARADRRGPKGIREITDVDLGEISLVTACPCR